MIEKRPTPWNAFITPYDYFTELYEPFPFEFILSIVFNYATVSFLFVSIKLGPKIPFTAQFVFGLSTFFITMFLVPFVPMMTSDRTTGIVLTLFFAFLTGIATATLFGATLGLAAMFPPTYTTAIMIGQGLGGVVVGLLRLVTKAAIPDDVSVSTFLYFMVAAALMLACLIGYFVLIRLPYARFHMRKAHKPPKDPLDERPLLRGGTTSGSDVPGREKINDAMSGDGDGGGGADGGDDTMQQRALRMLSLVVFIDLFSVALVRTSFTNGRVSHYGDPICLELPEGARHPF